MVLCLHGFPDHARSYRHQLPALAAEGFLAVAPMMRGYEPSSQPAEGDYQLIRIAEDVIEWIDQLGGRVHLVGHDWGAIASYAVAALAPERLKSLTTMAIPHPGRLARELLVKRPSQLAKSWYVLFFQLPGVADLVVEKDDWSFIQMLWRRWSPGWSLPDEELRAIKTTLAQPGVKRAALGYYRAMLAAASRETRQLLATEIQVPTLALTGALDGCMDTRLHDDVMRESDFPRGLRVVRLEGAGHFLHQEQPEATNRLLCDWLLAHE